MRLALAGNQNSGKTTLFNVLTGSNQHVGNFPGVTVDQKSGEIKGLKNATLVDLPGIYSIRPYTMEEIVTKDYIINEKPDGIINIVDATNIERNLYLTLQILELKVPTVIALNMMDELRNNGGTVDTDKLSKLLGVPVVAISAAKEEGIADLLNVVEKVCQDKILPQVSDFCKPSPVHRCIHAVSHVIEDHANNIGVSSRFATMQVILKDEEFTKKLRLDENERELIDHSIKQMEDEGGLDYEAAIAQMRYEFIEDACSKAVNKPVVSKERIRSEKIDKILTNKFLAIPIFVLIMALVFYATFELIGPYLQDLLAAAIEWLAGIIDVALTNYGINEVVHSLIIDGILEGVGSVISFMPIIVVLFIFLSILEDTGYMARVAFVMDKVLRKIGLSGKSIVPMLIGFGCSVPAAMSTRTLTSERDRKMTILLVPFMSCSAKVPLYAFFTAAFFSEHQGLVMTALYFLGILVGILAALILNKFVFTGKAAPFVMELPNYRLPSLKTVVILMWQKAKDFLQKAFSIIFISTIAIWFLESFDIRLNIVENVDDSILASVSRLIEPVFAPIGFGDWRAVTALVTGFIAKESVVSTLELLTAASGITITGLFTVCSVTSYLVFCLLYTPCAAAVGAIKRELGSAWQTVIVVICQCSVAWLVSFIVYHIAVLL